MELPLIIVLLCVAIALWAVAGAVGAIAQRLDDQVRLHQLKLNVIRLHERYNDAALFQPIEEVDVDVYSMSDIETADGADAIELPNADTARQAA